MKYGCIALFRHDHENADQVTKFEERVVLTEASSLQNAEEIFLREFEEYATDGVVFLNKYSINEIEEYDDSKVLEVSSSMKVFDGTDQDFIEKFYYDQRPESCDDVGWKHVWHNVDNIHSGCYNCLEEREGRLWKK